MTKFSEEVKVFIAANVKGKLTSELTELVNQEFGTTYKQEQIRGYKQRNKLTGGVNTCFKKGCVPHNKGMKGVCYVGSERTHFQKGQLPINHRPVGSERVCSKDGYIYIKVAEPVAWKLKHRLIWEKEKGKIPKGHHIIFLDGNKHNLDINNLFLISRSENLVINQMKLRSEEASITETGILLAKLICAKNNVRKH